MTQPVSEYQYAEKNYDHSESYRIRSIRVESMQKKPSVSFHSEAQAQMDTYNNSAEPWIPIAHYVDSHLREKTR